MLKNSRQIILGAGFSGLGAGYQTNIPIFEASDASGGICRSYYRSSKKISETTSNSKGFRFEVGGGHWIFDKNPNVLNIFSSLVSMQRYQKRSSVWIASLGLKIPTPIQRNIDYFPKKIADQILSELRALNPSNLRASKTMEEWLMSQFGPTLCKYFFFPFHEKYTAGLYRWIAPQDEYKTPNSKNAVRDKGNITYNDIFYYPDQGLNELANRLSEHTVTHYGKKVIDIKADEHAVLFEDGSKIVYEQMIATIPLQKLTQLTHLASDDPDPYTSVLVLNIGAVKGKKCPEDHWIYCPESSSGFHRVGFYSNVSKVFLPDSVHSSDLISIYVEFSYRPECKPNAEAIEILKENTVAELMQWDIIKDALIVDDNWIETAYTWRKLGSEWVNQSIEKMLAYDIFPVGRFAEWRFQGLSKSFYDGVSLATRLNLS